MVLANIDILNRDGTVGKINGITPLPVSILVGGSEIGPDSPVSIRLNMAYTVTIANGANLSGEIDLRAYSGFLLHMPGTWTAASIGFYVSSTTGGTFQPLYNENGALIQIAAPVASTSYTLPAELFAARFMRLWSQNGAGVNVAQGGDRVIVVDLKA